MDAKPVVVGVDGSPDSLRALTWAAEYARRFELPLEAVAAYQMPIVLGPAGMAGFEDSDTLEKSAGDMLTAVVREALGESAQVAERTALGHPGEVLVRMSRGASLLVVGSRGRGGFTGMLLGSVSQHCVTHARCPVLVMPHEDPEAQ